MQGVIGFTTLFTGTFAPRGWAFCNGQLMSIQQNTALFSVIGVTFGGNGTTNFQLPNLQGRAAVGAGQGPGLSMYVAGQPGGTEVSFITGTQMPVHTHSLHAQIVPGGNGTPNTPSPATAYYATGGNDIFNYSTDTAMQTYNATLTLGLTGYNPLNTPTSFPTLHPVLGINYIICVSGVFPARN